MQYSLWIGSEVVSRLATFSSAIIIVNGKAHQLAVPNGKVEVAEIPELYFEHDETDTCVILYLKYAKQDSNPLL